MQSERKYSEACEQNKDSILNVLKSVFSDCNTVLEIGSGSGQHAVYFAKHLPHLTWHPTDMQENLASIRAWIAEDPQENIHAPTELDVCQHQWAVHTIDAIFSANTLHIMSWPMIEDFFKGVGQVLRSGGKLLVYGPFSFHGKHTSPSNAQFDQYLKHQNPLRGVRDFAELNALALEQSLRFIEDIAMPANNHCLLWKRS